MVDISVIIYRTKKTIYDAMVRTLVKLGCETKPDFIIINAQRGVTSGLFGTPEQYSGITPPLAKQVHYFDNDEWYGRGQLREYHDYFSREQKHILESRSLISDPGKTLKTVPEFLEVPYEELSLHFKNIRRNNEKASDKNELLQLQEFYQPYNEKLFLLIGERFHWGPRAS